MDRGAPALVSRSRRKVASDRVYRGKVVLIKFLGDGESL